MKIALDRTIFLQSRTCPAALWLCNQTRFDNTGMPKLSPSSVHTMSMPPLSQAAMPARRTGQQKGWEGTRPRQLATAGCRDVSYHMLFPAVKAGGKMAERHTFSVGSCKLFCFAFTCSFCFTILILFPTLLGESERAAACC